MFNQLTVTIIHEDLAFVKDLKTLLEVLGLGVVSLSVFFVVVLGFWVVFF